MRSWNGPRNVIAESIHIGPEIWRTLHSATHSDGLCWTPMESIGANKDSIGASKESIGANKDSIGASKDFVRANKDYVRASKESNGTSSSGVHWSSPAKSVLVRFVGR
jgi:hypothetical protein